MSCICLKNKITLVGGFCSEEGSILYFLHGIVSPNGYIRLLLDCDFLDVLYAYNKPNPKYDLFISHQL